MQKDLTKGNIGKTMLVFAGPMIAGNMLQQFYNIADSFIVGKFIGANALAAVGSAYAFMTFLTSVLIGLCMGSGAIFSFYKGKNDMESLKSSVYTSFILTGGITLILNVTAFLFLDIILVWLKVPNELITMMKSYLFIILFGVLFIFIYNFFSFLLRSLGNSDVPLYFLGVAVTINVILDILLITVFEWDIEGAAVATVISQAVSAAGIAVYTIYKFPELRYERGRGSSVKITAGQILKLSAMASLQQSVMNFGILVIQGLVNSFGIVTMAAFAAAVKIDSFAYMPAQEFGNAYSLFISQNYGAGEKNRVKQGTRTAVQISLVFCILISVIVFASAKQLMWVFVSPEEIEIINTGIVYLRIEGVFYCGIGLLFLLYGYFRGINRPVISLVLTVISLGTRVLLSYVLSSVPAVGVLGIWASIPIGWILADITGFIFMKKTKIV